MAQPMQWSAGWRRRSGQRRGNANRRRTGNGIVKQRSSGRRARGVLPTPGTERDVTPGDRRRNGSLAPLYSEWGRYWWRDCP
jgi:hypothetical protein